MSLLKSSNNITVGKETYYNGEIKLVASDKSKILIGNYCAIGNNFKIITLNHDYNYPSILGKFYKLHFNINHPGEINNNPTIQRTKGNVYVGSDVWIGDDVTVLSGVKIGHGCCIGAKSLVTKDLPPYSVCGGIPCKVLKYRYQENIINFLMKLKWWDWSDDKIKKNRKFFCSNLNLLSLEELQKIIVS